MAVIRCCERVVGDLMEKRRRDRRHAGCCGRPARSWAAMVVVMAALWACPVQCRSNRSILGKCLLFLSREFPISMFFSDSSVCII